MLSQSTSDALTITTFVSIILGIITLVSKTCWSWLRARQKTEINGAVASSNISQLSLFDDECRIEHKSLRTTAEAQGKLLAMLTERLEQINKHGTDSVQTVLKEVNNSIIEFGKQVGGLSARVGSLERIVLDGHKKEAGNG